MPDKNIQQYLDSCQQNVYTIGNKQLIAVQETEHIRTVYTRDVDAPLKNMTWKTPSDSFAGFYDTRTKLLHASTADLPLKKGLTMGKLISAYRYLLDKKIGDIAKEIFPTQATLSNKELSRANGIAEIWYITGQLEPDPYIKNGNSFITIRNIADYLEDSKPAIGHIARKYVAEHKNHVQSTYCINTVCLGCRHQYTGQDAFYRKTNLYTPIKESEGDYDRI